MGEPTPTTFPLAGATTPVSNTVQGRYRLAEVIGTGGMATVYRATDELLGREVAVKVFRASARDRAELRRQETEARVLAGLSHHALVTLLDAGVDCTDPEEPRVFMVMELADGSDLQRRLTAQGTLSPLQSAYLGYDLAEGLEYIHERGVVHRDVKPANILLAQHGRVRSRQHAKLTDFGIALLAGTPDDRLGKTTGTAAFLSPEQANSAEVGPASDVYSLGLVLLQCFTGQIAFPGEIVSSALARLLRDPVIPDSIDPAWRRLLASMTARNPAERPSVPDLVLAFRQLVMDELGRESSVDSALIPQDEAARMSAVRRYEILDTPPDGAFDRITALAARIFSVPVAIVSVVDHDRIWFKSHHGLEVDQIGRDSGLCASAILQDEPWVIKNARMDPRTLANPLVASEFGLQFYAGVPLRTREGYGLGTLCVLDFAPRPISDDDMATLQDLAAMVMSELELRLESRRAIQQLR